MGPANLGPLQFSEPLTAASEDGCRWYHMFDKPDGSVIRGSWDYRHNVDDYLGQVDFRDKSVLEIGPASGFLTSRRSSAVRPWWRSIRHSVMCGSVCRAPIETPRPGCGCGGSGTSN
jgi:hypothetical protein